MTLMRIKSKVAEITQKRVTPFKNDFLRESWLHWCIRLEVKNTNRNITLINNFGVVISMKL